MEPSTCPEPISDNPKLALGWLAITICLFFEMSLVSLSDIFSNGVNNVGSLELRPKGKSNFG